MRKIKYFHVTDDPSDHLLNGFVQVYKEAFGGPPYFESYTDEEVIEGTWRPHFDIGIIVLALDEETGAVVGLGCAKPMAEAPSTDLKFLAERQQDGSCLHNIAAMWYMSEVAVLNDYRRNGIGTQLVGERLKRVLSLGAERYSFRTAAEGSNSLRIYRRIGAEQLPGFIDMSVTDQMLVNESQSDRRIFLHGVCEEALAKIEALSNEN